MLKTICLFLLFSLSSLYADISSIVDIYRTKGIQATQKTLDRYLATTEYWDKKISGDDLRFGWYEKPIYLLILNTDKKNIAVYHYTDDRVEHLLNVNIVLGSKGVGKQTEGDRRTPIGIYRITQRMEHPAQMYGPLAFVTNYPNEIDKTLSKDGSGIWIHGFPPDKPDKSFTKGCIATQNKNLLKLDRTIEYKNSLVVISAGKPFESTHKEISQIMAFVYKWRYNWKYGLLDDYLSLYSKDLISANGDFEHFKRHKSSIFSRKEKKTIRFYNFQVTKYPNILNKSIWRVSMDEYYKTSSYLYSGKKIIYLLQGIDGFKIWREL